MTETMQFPIGAEVACRDGECGRLTRIVVDPVAREVTHLVVEPKHRSGLGRLVPIELVETSAEQIRLGCGLAEFAKLADAEETEFLPGSGGTFGYGPNEAFAWPYYGLVGMGGGMLGMGGNSTAPLVYDRIPLGEVEVRRGDQVHASDGLVGRVQGLVIDPDDHQVTHVLLQEGHLWGRKEVAIPISAVTSVNEGIRVGLTKDEVGDLPSIEIEHPDWV
jgi:sporulation protein YlmC with PRC-barrel domain